MFKVIMNILPLVAIVIAGYILIAKDHTLLWLLMLLLGLVMLTMGVNYIGKGQKTFGILFIIVFILLLTLSIQALLQVMN